MINLLQQLDAGVEFDPQGLRQIIEDLRKLPNVSELCIIKAIAELDRIASHCERLAKLQQEHAEAAIESLRKSLDESREKILSGEIKATDGCMCPRCMSIRAVLENAENRTPQAKTLQ